jgi:CRP-like cAMP-binding protein
MNEPGINGHPLRHIPLLSNLNETEYRQLAEITHLVEFRPGETVLRYGETTQDLWLILEGTCEVYKPGINGDPLVLAVLEPHSILGEMSFFHKAPHSASVRAKSPLKLLRISRCDYDELIQDGAPVAFKLAYNVVATLAERLRRMDQWVEDLVKSRSRSETASTSVSALEAEEPASEWNDFRTKLFTGWNL